MTDPEPSMDVLALCQDLRVDRSPAGHALEAWWNALGRESDDACRLCRINVEECRASPNPLQDARDVDRLLTDAPPSRRPLDHLGAATSRKEYQTVLLRGRTAAVAHFAADGGVAHVVREKSIRNFRNRRAGLTADDVPISVNDVLDFLAESPMIWQTTRATLNDALAAGGATEVCVRLGLAHYRDGDRMAVLETNAPPLDWVPHVPTFWDSCGFPYWGAAGDGDETGWTRHLYTGDRSAREAVARWKAGDTTIRTETDGTPSWHSIGAFSALTGNERRLAGRPLL